MDPHTFDNAYWVITASIVGFLVLAFILLYPVHRFIKREEEESRAWTDEEIARAARHERHAGDGDAEGTPDLSDDLRRKNHTE